MAFQVQLLHVVHDNRISVANRQPSKSCNIYPSCIYNIYLFPFRYEMLEHLTDADTYLDGVHAQCVRKQVRMKSINLCDGRSVCQSECVFSVEHIWIAVDRHSATDLLWFFCIQFLPNSINFNAINCSTVICRIHAIQLDGAYECRSLDRSM